MDPDPRCVACGRRLRTADSIRAGIGPTCRNRGMSVAEANQVVWGVRHPVPHPKIPGQLALDDQKEE